MRIRNIERKDLENVFKLVTEAFEDTPTAFNFNEIPEIETFHILFENKLMMLSEGSSVDLISEENGRILANCEIVRVDKNTGILGIVVSLDSRRDGIGSALLKKALLAAGKSGMIRILAEVSSGNRIGICFLEKNGFGEEKSAQTEHDDSDFPLKKLTFIKII